VARIVFKSLHADGSAAALFFFLAALALVLAVAASAADFRETPVRTLTGQRGPVLSVAFSPDGRTLAAAGRKSAA
jgi:WD40 repeat protein